MVSYTEVQRAIDAYIDALTEPLRELNREVRVR